MRKGPIHWTAASSAKCKAGSPPGNRVSMITFITYKIQNVQFSRSGLTFYLYFVHTLLLTAIENWAVIGVLLPHIW